jgi:hypothetical protein
MAGVFKDTVTDESPRQETSAVSHVFLQWRRGLRQRGARLVINVL